MTSLSNVYAGSMPEAAGAHPAPVDPVAHQAPLISPTQAVIAEAQRVAHVHDALGRRLGIVRVSAALRRRVLKAMSAENGDKPQLFIMALAAASCVEIDGERVPFPTTERQIDALIDRLEQEGLNAISGGWVQYFPVDEVDLKNS